MEEAPPRAELTHLGLPHHGSPLNVSYAIPKPPYPEPTCSDHYYISVHGSCLTYFINPQRYLPTTQTKGIKESIAVMPGLVRISNRVFWVSRYGILYAEGAGWEGGGV